ncbi:cytochrome b [Stagnihabitans tardus]|uniref:Cytochrome b n=1 Tax=Stagnihabitans tardus TaxID=2699202 RepID=A0AAE5BWE7_9RHOB|nr:cytochrome b/b6 domain-containing protein [Stagnihabitans tardus]NBZ88218.1 cytochrome b [Stagnihabitans tardus]
MVQGYSRLQIILHWVVGVLILYQLLMGEDMKPLWDELQRNGSYTMTLGGLLHILFGVLILALVLWRLVLRLTRGVPDAPDSTPAMETAAKIGHLAIYALMIGLPVTGLLAFFAGIDILAELHEGPLKALLWVLILGHVVMALYHQFVLKDGLLDRMRTPR